jgi:hypothetical protein
MAFRSFAVCVLLATATAGCQQLVGIGDLSLTGDDTGSDGGGAVPVVIASVGSVQAPSGQAQQTKIIYATGSQRWWLFYIDGAEPKLLKTKYSADFATWNDGEALTLAEPHGGDGRGISVAYATVNGNDVVHVVMSQQISLSDRRLYHARATISGTTITFGAPVERFIVSASSPSLDPDGPATAIASDGHVADLTSWIEKLNGTGDAYVVRSAAADLGTSWDGVWAPEVQLEIVRFAINAHGMVAMASGSLLALWEDAATRRGVRLAARAKRDRLGCDRTHADRRSHRAPNCRGRCLRASPLRRARLDERSIDSISSGQGWAWRLSRQRRARPRAGDDHRRSPQHG